MTIINLIEEVYKQLHDTMAAVGKKIPSRKVSTVVYKNPTIKEYNTLIKNSNDKQHPFFKFLINSNGIVYAWSGEEYFHHADVMNEIDFNKKVKFPFAKEYEMFLIRGTVDYEGGRLKIVVSESDIMWTVYKKYAPNTMKKNDKLDRIVDKILVKAKIYVKSKLKLGSITLKKESEVAKFRNMGKGE